MSSGRARAVVLLGAGWSANAGRPLTNCLFEVSPYAASAKWERMYDRVVREWLGWRRDHPHEPAEAFIGSMTGTTVWPAVVRFIAARLAEPDQVRLENELRYGERITKPSPSASHHAFIAKILAEYDLIGVVTMNYDLLAERTLRHRVMLRPPRPGFYYAGLPSRTLQGASTFSVRHKWVELTGTVPLCKLHGSLNWVADGDGLTAFADCRPAFRAAPPSFIVAPAPEKTTPERLAAMWEIAASLLDEADVWVVVGYSAPLYDEAIATLLSTASSSKLQVRVVDPNIGVTARFQALTGSAVVLWAGDLETFLQ